MDNKKNLDWQNIGFTYRQTDKRYVSYYKDGTWDDGTLTDDVSVTLNECAGIFQYCQEIFEGLKAYTTREGSIVTFRPDQNAERMMNSAKGLEIPPFPKERFPDALDQVVRANAAWVPPYGSGATRYVRPYMFASSPVIGVKPAEEYQFRIICTPVGPYFKSGAKPLSLCVSGYDRAASLSRVLRIQPVHETFHYRLLILLAAFVDLYIRQPRCLVAAFFGACL